MPLLLIVLGVGIGTFGTLVGAGGGFLLVPLIALLEPALPTSAVTAISLAVVAMNAGSGAIAYARQRRIDYRSGLIFAIAALPGGVGGALLTRVIPRNLFDIVFAILLVTLGVFIYRRRDVRHEPAPEGAGWGQEVREIRDASGRLHRYSANVALGVAISFVVGFASSVLGIGGGVIHVPALIGLLGFPPHVAAATSHFVLAIVATVGTATHAAAGDLDGLVTRTVLIGAGAIVGAQIGARISERVRGRYIVTALAVSLVFVGLRLAAQALFAI